MASIAMFVYQAGYSTWIFGFGPRGPENIPWHLNSHVSRVSQSRSTSLPSGNLTLCLPWKIAIDRWFTYQIYQNWSCSMSIAILNYQRIQKTESTLARSDNWMGRNQFSLYRNNNMAKDSKINPISPWSLLPFQDVKGIFSKTGNSGNSTENHHNAAQVSLKLVKCTCHPTVDITNVCLPSNCRLSGNLT